MEPHKLTTQGRHKQNKMGHHGIKGAKIGGDHGSKSLESEKYKTWMQLNDANMVPDDKKGGRSKSLAGPKPKGKCLVGLTFREQLIFVQKYRQNQVIHGTDVPVYMMTAKEF